MKYTETYGQRSAQAPFPNTAKSLPQERMLSDKSRQLSVSFIPTDEPAPRRGRLCERRARQPYLLALGISEAPSDLSDPLWCLRADSSTNTSADGCRSLFSIVTEGHFCLASAANAGLSRPSLPSLLIYLFIPIKAKLAALYEIRELIEAGHLSILK